MSRYTIRGYKYGDTECPMSKLQDLENKIEDKKLIGVRCGDWIITENGCVITCSECNERLELSYPDGTEVRWLPHCPYCGTKMRKEQNDGKAD
jgi:hypothetical protein